MIGHPPSSAVSRSLSFLDPVTIYGIVLILLQAFESAEPFKLDCHTHYARRSHLENWKNLATRGMPRLGPRSRQFPAHTANAHRA
jgi:hypothetical protein